MTAFHLEVSWRNAQERCTKEYNSNLLNIRRLESFTEDDLALHQQMLDDLAVISKSNMLLQHPCKKQVAVRLMAEKAVILCSIYKIYYEFINFIIITNCNIFLLKIPKKAAILFVGAKFFVEE